MAMMRTRVPGTMLCTICRSTDRSMFRGISPVGTSSGFSCSFSVCKSTNSDFSGTMTYGSSPQLPSPAVDIRLAAHDRGAVQPLNPGLTGIFKTDRQVLHCTVTLFAFALGRAAAIMIPGTTTSLEMWFDVRSRIADGRSPDMSST
eukprot:scaffold304_cov409-Prasinococcus_capsulatus_cf.AAC.20